LEEVWPCHWCSFACPWHSCCCPNPGCVGVRLWCSMGPLNSEPSALLVKKYIILPVLLSVPTPSQGGGTPPEGYGFMMFVVRVAGSLPGVWWFALPLSLMTGGLCHMLRLDAIAACRSCECLVEVVSYRAGVDQRVRYRMLRPLWIGSDGQVEDAQHGI